MPGADPADFFNYGLNINTWKEYVARIHQFRLEFTMQKKIQTYESSHDTPAQDPDLPPELAAAVAQGRQQVCPTACSALNYSVTKLKTNLHHMAIVLQAMEVSCYLVACLLHLASMLSTALFNKQGIL